MSFDLFSLPQGKLFASFVSLGNRRDCHRFWRKFRAELLKCRIFVVYILYTRSKFILKAWICVDLCGTRDRVVIGYWGSRPWSISVPLVHAARSSEKMSHGTSHEPQDQKYVSVMILWTKNCWYSFSHHFLLCGCKNKKYFLEEQK